MDNILLSLEPIEEARWETNPETGVRFQVAALDAETDQKFTRESTDDKGRLDFLAYYGRVTEHCVKNWEGVGAKKTPVPCNTENRAKLIRTHGFVVGSWITRQAQSLDHYRVAEVTAAKNA